MASLVGGTPRAAQLVVELGSEKYTLLNESQAGQVSRNGRAWVLTPTPIQEATGPELPIPVSFDGGSGVSFASAAIPNGYEYANGWSTDAANRAGTWPRRATLAAMPVTYADSDATHATALTVLQGWIIPFSTYVYVARGRYCCKYAIDDTQDSVWPIVEAHDFGTGVFITGRPVAFKGKAYFPLRTGTSGSLARWHELSLPVASTVQQQTVTITGTPTSGTYTLTFNGKTTAAIAFNAVASAVQSALRLIAGLEGVTVSSTGSTPNFVHTVVMTGASGALATAAPPVMTNVDGTAGGTHGIANAISVAGATDTWRQGSANTQASCFYVNGRNLWRANANTIASTQSVSTPSIDGDWGATTEVGDSGHAITDLGGYLGDNLVMTDNGMYRFTEDLQSIQELPDLAAVVDSQNGVGSEFHLGYEVLPHKSGLVRWRPGSYLFVGPEQEGALEGDRSLGWGRVASLAPYGKQLFFAANDAYDGAGTIGSLLPQVAEGRGRDYGVIPNTHVVTANASYEAVRVVTSSTQPAAPQFPATWSDDNAVGTITWSNPSNAGAYDGALATAAAGTSHYLKGLAPPVNLPSNATVQGVQVEIAKKSGAVSAFTPNVNGYVYAQNTVYATAQTGSNLIAASSNGTIFAGQQLSGGLYQPFEGLVSFDTSAIPDAATVLSATLTLTSKNAANGSGYILQARLYDFGATIETADWVAGASLASKTLLATASVLPASANLPVPFTSAAAFAANINVTGSTRIVLCSDRQVASTAPTGLEFASFTDSTDANSAYRPTLTVTYTGATVDSVVKLVIGGTVSGTNLADAVTLWPSAISGYTSYGGASSLWGLTPTAAQVNASNFGVVFSATVASGETASVDAIRMTVYYTTAGIADPQSYRVDLQVDTTKTIATGQVYKLARGNLPVVSDPNVNHAASNVQIYSARYTQPHRNVQKIYREVELWLEANPQTNTPGLQVWASVDDGAAFQLNDSTGAASTVYATGAKRFYFPATAAALGHYCQLQFKIPALSGGTVAVAVALRDVVLRCLTQAYQANELTFSLLLGAGEFADKTPSRLSVDTQKANLLALNQPGAAIAYSDPNGESGYLAIEKVTFKEYQFKEYSQSTTIAEILARTIEYTL